MKLVQRWCLLLLLVAIALGGCGSDSRSSSPVASPPAAGDCSEQVKYQGVIYNEAGFAASPASMLDKAAVLSACNDTGTGADPGADLSRGTRVEVFAVRNVAPTVAVAIKGPGGSFKVFLSSIATAAERRKARQQLETAE